MKKVGFVSLGCPKNLVDSEVMLGLLERRGHDITPDPGDAEVIVVNTCSFIEGAKQESIDAILEMAELKASGKCQRLVVTGCLAERYPDALRSELVEVDAILGTNQIEEIARAVEGEPTPLPSSFGRSDADLYLYDHSTPRRRTTPRPSAYVKIAEGCDHTCAFCIIPKLRGNFRSRSIHSIVEEARQLAGSGVREITLVSQDTTSFGVDVGVADGLAHLLQALVRVDGLRWIRLLYLYPTMVSARLLEVMASQPKICKYVDMPLQHASARMLRAMRRGGSRKTLTRLVERIRKGIPDVVFRTTMIVGFPGESDADFDELARFCRELEFDRLGVFTYSDEENTTGVDLHPKVPRRTAERRRRVLMRQQAAIARRKGRQLVGREFPILIEGPAADTDLLVQGRMQGQAPEIDGVCLVNDSRVDPLQPGEFYRFRVTRALEHDLLGTVVGRD